MNSSEVNTFDIDAFTGNLIAAGIDKDDALAIARDAANKSAAALEKAEIKRHLLDVGLGHETAEMQARAALAFDPKNRKSTPAAALTVHKGPQSIGSFFELPAAFAQEAESSLEAPPVEPVAKKAAASKSRPASKFKTGIERKKKPDNTAETLPEQPSLPGLADPTGAAKKTRVKAPKVIIEKPVQAVFDYQIDEIPDRVRELIETNLAIEAEDAKSAGTLGFMTRSLAVATLPHRRVKDSRFIRKNGDFTLTMMTAHPEGLPFGTMPRLLLTWVCTEVAQKRDRVLSLGEDMAAYLEVLGLHRSGGERGDITRLKHGMTTLFSSVISCHYEGQDAFVLNNISLANRVAWWTPQNPEFAGKWQSELELSEQFYKECTEHVLPFDLRAVAALRQSPLALDIYMWLTHRMSYLQRRTVIPWAALGGQFGTGFALEGQGLRDFKRAFLTQLKNVLVIYPNAKVSEGQHGLILYPSAPHVLTREQAAQARLGY